MRSNLVGFLLIVISFVIGFALVWPKIGEVHDKTVETSAKKQVSVNLEKRKEALVALNATFSSQQQKIQSIMASLPPQPQIPDVLVALEAMGQESNASISSISPQDVTSLHQVNVSVSGQAGLANIESFMNAISLNNRPMSVVGTTITKSDNNLDYSITANLPYSPVGSGIKASQ